MSETSTPYTAAETSAFNCPKCGGPMYQDAPFEAEYCPTCFVTPADSTLFAPPLTEATGEGEKPWTDAERAQALRDDVRKKYEAALPRVLEAGRWFRIEAILDEADAQAKELATLRTRLQEAEDAGAAKDAALVREQQFTETYAKECGRLRYQRDELSARAEKAEAENADLRAKLAREGEQEAQLLKRDEELRGLRAEMEEADVWLLFYRDGKTIGQILEAKGNDWRAVSLILRSIRRAARNEDAVLSENLDGAALPLQGEEGKGGQGHA